MKDIPLNSLKVVLEQEGPKQQEKFNEISVQLAEMVKERKIEITVTGTSISVKILDGTLDELTTRRQVQYVAGSAISIAVACLHGYFLEGNTPEAAQKAVREYVWKYKVPFVRTALTKGYHAFYSVKNAHGKWFSVKSAVSRWDFDPDTGFFIRNDGARYLNTDLEYPNGNRERNQDYDVLSLIFR